MANLKLSCAMLLTVGLLGCASTTPATQISANKDITISQAACCKTFSEFSWQTLTGRDQNFNIDSQSPVGLFAEGKSYFASWVLPENLETMQIEINSILKSRGGIAPKLLLLDKTLTPVREIELDQFQVSEPNLLNQTSYQYTVELSRSTTPFMVIYSPVEYRKGQIKIPHPARLRAEELGLARPMVTDPVIQHGSFGEIKLIVNASKSRAYRYQPQTQTQVPVVTQGVATITDEHANTNAPVNVTPQTEIMLSETEAFYNTQIKQAVMKKDLSRALKLLAEAKRAGSTTAEALFISLLK